MDEIETIVSAVVHDRFPENSIQSVSVEQDVDQDGDPILKVTVVFDPAEGALDTHRVMGLIRHLRPKLLEKKYPEFPIFRFVSKKDAASLKIAAA